MPKIGGADFFLTPVREVVLVPGLLLIFLHSCKIKSGRDLGMRLTSCIDIHSVLEYFPLVFINLSFQNLDHQMCSRSYTTKKVLYRLSCWPQEMVMLPCTRLQNV